MKVTKIPKSPYFFHILFGIVTARHLRFKEHRGNPLLDQPQKNLMGPDSCRGGNKAGDANFHPYNLRVLKDFQFHQVS